MLLLAGYEVGVTPQHDGDVGSVLDFDCGCTAFVEFRARGCTPAGPERTMSLGEGGEGLEEGGLPLPVALRSLERGESPRPGPSGGQDGWGSKGAKLDLPAR